MILISLTLHNFMSYAEATLDLSSLPIVCLTGLNGAGKSALLDALTWALWETGRSSSDELIRLGEKEMWVDLTFIQENQKYRVRRSRLKIMAKAGARVTSKGSLEFQVLNEKIKEKTEASLAQATTGAPRHGRESSWADASAGNFPTDGAWRSLTGASVKHTQKLITDLLRMDFDTFVNSAYLRQGKADEFITRAPSERKQVLSDILGLTYFDRLQEKARERVKDLKHEAESVSRDLANLPGLEVSLRHSAEAFERTRQQFELTSNELAASELELDELARELASKELDKERLLLGDTHITTVRSDLSNLLSQKLALEEGLNALQKVLSREGEIVQSVAKFNALKIKVETFDKEAFEVQELTTQKLTYQHQLATMRARLEVELSSSSAKALELEEKSRRYEHDKGEIEKITNAYAHYRRSQGEEAELATRQETFARMTNRANELASQITETKIRLEADLFQKEQALLEHETVLRSERNLEEQKSELEEETTRLDKLETEFQLVEETGIKLKTSIEQKQHRIENLLLRQREKQQKIEELIAHCDESTCPLCSSPIVDRAAVVERYRHEIAQMEYEVTAEEAAIGNLQKELVELRKRYLEVRSGLQKRQILDKQIGQFNERLLAIERCKQTVEKTNKDIESIQSRLTSDNYAQLERESLIGIKAELHKLEFDPIAYSNIQSQIRMQRHVEVRYQQMHRDLLELKKVNESLPSLQEQVKQLQDELSSESYGLSERTALLKLQGKLLEFSYDRMLHSSLKEQLSALLPMFELSRELDAALKERPLLEDAARLCQAQITTKEEQVKMFESEREKLLESVEAIPALLARLDHAKPAVQSTRETRESLSRNMAVLEAECRNLAESVDRLTESRNKLQSINEKLDDHIFLAEAFGKKGIQAVIIENAIPEIETEANRILSKLSENKMHVAFITQQKNKSGGTTETLDLVIGDEIGTRNYELFSGGEAFKVNFAIRVALSRLLARRSGARLETLIVDEGFGSQDETSRERLVRSIQAIQSEFARIVVITHMSDIKDMFPVQIHVSKDAGSSRLQVMF